MSDRSSGDSRGPRANPAPGAHGASSPGAVRAPSKGPVPSAGASAPLVRAVVVSREGGPNLSACLESLERQGFSGLAVTVADNASPGGAAMAAASVFPQMSAVRNAKNLGFAGGANTGLRLALAEGARYAFVLNDDVTLLPGCVRALFDAMEADARLGACQPLLLDAADETRVASAGCFVCLTGRCGDLDAGGHVEYGSMPNTHSGRLPPASLARPVPAVTGAAMFLRAEALAQAGLFDDSFFMYFEDVELSLRIRRLGFETACVDCAKALHVGGATASKLPLWRKIARCEKNALILAARHFPPMEATLALTLGPLCSLAAALYRLGLARPKDALAYAAGSLAGLALGLKEIARRLTGMGRPGADVSRLIDRRTLFP